MIAPARPDARMLVSRVGAGTATESDLPQAEMVSEFFPFGVGGLAV